MIALILFVVIGVLFAYFATLNTTLTAINLGGYIVSDIPLYIVVISAFAIGLFTGGLFSVVKQLLNQRKLYKQNSQLSKIKQDTLSLTREIHKLEIENARLKTKLGESVDDAEV